MPEKNYIFFKKKKKNVWKIGSVKVRDSLLKYFRQYLRSDKLKCT